MSLLLGLITSGIAGTLVLIILLLFRPITEKLFSKTWHYYSLFVPLFFLLGGTIFAGAMMNQTQHFRMESNVVTPARDTGIYISQNPFQVPQSFSQLEAGMHQFENTTIINPIVHSSITEQLFRHIGNVTHIIIAFWALGVALFMGISIKKYLQYRRLVLHKAKPFRGYYCEIPIVTSQIAHTPMLIGFIKPIIVLPDLHFEDAKLDVILSHELIHYKRKDLLLKMVGQIANAVHWCNPATYILNRQLNTFCELSCDEEVVSKMDAIDRRFYGETILQVLQYSTTRQELVGNLMFATNLCNSKNNIKRRLLSMMNTSKKMKKSIAALSLAVGILAVGGGFFISHMVNSAMPVYASEADYTAKADSTSEADYAVAPNLADESIETAEAINQPTQPVIYQGNVVGVETTEHANDVLVEAAPLIFDGINEMLEVIYQEMGNIMFPTYLPEGFVLSEIGTMHPIDFTLHPELFTDGCYNHLNELIAIFSDGEDNISLSVRYFQPYARVLAGSNELRRLTADDVPILYYSEGGRNVTINGMNATIRRYSGLIMYDIESGLAHRFSDDANEAATYDGVSYQFMTAPDSTLTDDDLIRVAESLVHVMDLMQ